MNEIDDVYVALVTLIGLSVIVLLALFYAHRRRLDERKERHRHTRELREWHETSARGTLGEKPR